MSALDTGMRKIIESTLVSLDGVVESPWEWAPFDDEAKAWALANLRGYDGFLLGRGTFEALRAGWEHVHGDDYIDAINAARKYVVSDSLPLEPGWNAEVLRGGVAAVAALRNQPGRPLVKYGTTRLTRALLEHGLVDEFQFSILPVRVGSGRHLFADLDGPAPPLTLTDTRTLRSGMVVLTYAVGGAPDSAG
jgi:dihydrofolate reductase